MIKHISFDLWLTLIRSHPLFKRKRAEIIADMCGRREDILQIEQWVKEQDKVFDRHNEMYDTKIPAGEMYLRLLQKAGTGYRKFGMNDAETLMNKSNETLMNFMPTLMNSNIPYMLSSLRSEGITLSLGSNTGFVEGKVLRKVLQELNIIQYFSFFIFSDEVKTSKPSLQFFRQIYNRVQLPKSCVLHVGDNWKTDYKGAVDFGFKALLIKNTHLDDIRAKL
jgi:putative hydrolase of the HAD superfamily